jgi:serine protease AprX
MTREKPAAQLDLRVAAGVALLALLPFLQPAVTAAGAHRPGRLAPDVQEKVRGAAPDDLIQIIVQLGDRASNSHLARLHGRGGAIKAHHDSIRGYTASVPAAQILALADDPEVESISLDAPVQAALDIAYRAVLADVAVLTTGLDGAGIGIAVVDTGVQFHRDLRRSQGAPQPLEVEIVGHEQGLADHYGHGTHVAGIINGNGAESSDDRSFRTFRGLAPGARLISLRALGPDGTGRTSDVIAAIDWAIQNRESYNIRVLNMSLGHPVSESYTTDPLCRAARAAVDAGIVVVVSAGNGGRVGSGFGTITSPGNEPSVITVGAMDDSDTVAREDDILAPYSSKGPSLIDFVVKPDLVAPGSFIVSLRARGSLLDVDYHDGVLKVSDYRSTGRSSDADGVYYVLSGTSLAAPRSRRV